MAEVRGTWRDVFGAASAEVQAAAQAARAAIRQAHAEAVEVARPGERSVCFGLGERKMSEAYAYLMPQNAWVNLGFFRGAVLPDPDGRLEGTGKLLRHVKLRAPAAASDPGIAVLIAAAIEERRRALGEKA